jgi:zinc/manganese transport system ATP-binding protein
MNLIEIVDVNVILNDKKVLEDINMVIESPSFLTIMGPNGAGKSTLIKLLLGIVFPSKGRVTVFGIDPTKNPLEVRKNVGYVPQKEHMSFEVPLTVGEVVQMGILTRKKIPRFMSKDDKRQVEEVLKVVEMLDKKSELFMNLSGGQQQRVLIARAVAQEPSILLLDEPFNGIDASNQNQILSFLRSIKEHGVTVIVVTHDINPLVNLTDYVMLLNKNIISFGKPEEVLNYGRLSQIYGPSVQVITGKPFPVVITGDTHA